MQFLNVATSVAHVNEDARQVSPAAIYSFTIG
jgi:hypothetical protein